MIRVIRAEWRKLRRPTLFLGTLGSVGAISILAASIPFIAMDAPRRGREARFTKSVIEHFTGLSLGLGNASTLLGIAALSIFASQTAQEYSHGTLRNLLVREPRRMVLLGGKALSMLLFACLVVVETTLLTVVTEYVWASNKQHIWKRGPGNNWFRLNRNVAGSAPSLTDLFYCHWHFVGDDRRSNCGRCLGEHAKVPTWSTSFGGR